MLVAFSNLKLTRFPQSQSGPDLAVALHSFTFYVAEPNRSILIPNLHFEYKASEVAGKPPPYNLGLESVINCCRYRLRGGVPVIMNVEGRIEWNSLRVGRFIAQIAIQV